MLSLSLAATLEKYKLSSTNPWYCLLDISMKGSVLLRIAKNPDDVSFQGNVYRAFAFEIDPIEEKSSGQLTTVQLKVSNVDRSLEGYLNEYDGGVDGKVTIYLVQAVNANGEPDLQLEFTIISTTAEADWVTFSLGADNPMRQPIPKFIYTANHCRFTYNTPAMQASGDSRGVECGYVGSMPSCSKTLDGANGCRAHNNQARFGGFPGIQAGTILTRL